MRKICADLKPRAQGTWPDLYEAAVPDFYKVGRAEPALQEAATQIQSLARKRSRDRVQALRAQIATKRA